jgi:hypothetical protein
MYKPTIFLSLTVIISLLAGCAGRPTEIKTITPTLSAQKVEPTLTPESASTTAAEVVSNIPLGSCPITIPQVSLFIAPAPYSATPPWPNQFWYGSKSLWVALPTNAIWSSLPLNPEGYTQKIPWWRDGYVWDVEPEPPLLVTGERLDDQAPPLNASTANGSYAADMGSAMMMGVDFPTLGCWKITGKYKDAELSFVVWVAP